MKSILKLAVKVVAGLALGVALCSETSAVAQSQTTPAVNYPNYVQQPNPIPIITNTGSVFTTNLGLGTSVVTTTITTNVSWNATASPPALTTNYVTNSVTNTTYIGGVAANQNFVPLEFSAWGTGGAKAIYTLARSVSGTFYDTTNEGGNINVTNLITAGQTNTVNYQLDMRGWNFWRMVYYQWTDTTNNDVLTNGVLCNSSTKKN